MNTLKNLFGIGLVAVTILTGAFKSEAQVWKGGIISTGMVTVVQPSTSRFIDVTKPPAQWPGISSVAARDNAWFEIGKDRGLTIQAAYGGTLTNIPLVFEASIDPNNRTNWTNTRFLVFNLGAAAATGVFQTNVPASVLANVRAIRLLEVVGTNSQGTFQITNVIVGYWQ